MVNYTIFRVLEQDMWGLSAMVSLCCKCEVLPETVKTVFETFKPGQAASVGELAAKFLHHLMTIVGYDNISIMPYEQVIDWWCDTDISRYKVEMTRRGFDPPEADDNVLCQKQYDGGNWITIHY